MFVVADADNKVFEGQNKGNNALLSSSPMSLVHPDLFVKQIVLPGGLQSGKNVNVQWTVENRGGGATPVSSWLDKVFLSRDTVIDASDVLLGQTSHTGKLNAGVSTTQQLSVLLPNGTEGAYYFLVQTDANDVVRETSDEGNNVGSQSGPLRLCLPSTVQRGPRSRYSNY